MVAFSMHQRTSPDERSKEGSVTGVRCRVEVFLNDDVIIAWKMQHGRGKPMLSRVHLFSQWLGELIVAGLPDQTWQAAQS